MVEETIKTIRETENEADAILKAAEAQCEELLENAKVQAENLKEEAKAQAQTKAKEALDVEKGIGETSMQEALAQVEADIKVLKESARSKEGDVISAVIAELV